MLNPQVAGQRLMEFMTTGSRKVQCERVALLNAEDRVAALALIGLKPDESPFLTEEGFTNWTTQRRQQEEMSGAQKEACAHIDNLALSERATLFAALLPRLSTLLAVWWERQMDSPSLYQRVYVRRPFRLRGDQANTVVAAQIGSLRQAELVHLIDKMSVYQEMPIEWFAAWAPYLGSLSLDTLGKFFAAAIDQGDEAGEAVFTILRESGRGDHEIGAMGRHVVRGLLTASRIDGWEFIEKLLLAAQRQEGLRQSILEVVDEAHPQAFLHMLGVIRENDLYRFSSTIRAVDVWFGMNWVAYEKLSVKQANAATEIVETFLRDPTGRTDVLASATDGQVVYLALWTIAFGDALAAREAASALIDDPILTRRYAALRILGELQLEEARAAIYAALDDPDLRVAQKAFELAEMYEHTAFSDAGAVTDIAGLEGYFERLERNIPRFPAKSKELEPVIWEWDKQTAHAPALADRLPATLRLRPVDRLFPYLSQMSGSGRARTITALGHLNEFTPEQRTVLFILASDTSSYVRDQALTIIARFELVPDEVQNIEALLTRKVSDLRKAALSLLIKQSEDATIASGERLLTSRDANQRLAGLDLMQQAIAKKRALERAQAAVRSFAATRGSKLTSAETAMLEPMLAMPEAEEEKPTLQNALGLMDSLGLTVAPQPVARDRFLYLTDSADAIVAGLNDFVTEHKDSVLSGGEAGASADTLLGNITYSWQMPRPRLLLTRDEDALRCPMHEELSHWWESRPVTLRDADGRELLRVQAAIQAAVVKRFQDSYPEAQWLPVEEMYSQVPVPKPATETFIEWLIRLYPPTQEEIIDFYLDAGETLCFHLSRYEASQWREKRRSLPYLQAARSHREQNPQAWTDAQFTRLWHLLRWLDQATPERYGRYRVANTEEIARAFHLGVANANDVYDDLLGAFDTNPNFYGSPTGLTTLLSRKNPSCRRIGACEVRGKVIHLFV